MQFTISTNRTVTSREFNELLEAVSWNGSSPMDESIFLQSSRRHTLVAHARGADGRLLGYVSAFSDETLSTVLGKLIVHPDAQRQGIGRALLQTVESALPGILVYAMALGEAKHFFESCGYRFPKVEMTVMFKKPPPGVLPAKPPGNMKTSLSGCSNGWRKSAMP